MTDHPLLDSLSSIFVSLKARDASGEWTPTDVDVLQQAIGVFRKFDADLAGLEKRFGDDHSALRKAWGGLAQELEAMAAKPMSTPLDRLLSRTGSTLKARDKLDDYRSTPAISASSDDLVKALQALPPEEAAGIMMKVALKSPMTRN